MKKDYKIIDSIEALNGAIESVRKAQKSLQLFHKKRLIKSF